MRVTLRLTLLGLILMGSVAFAQTRVDNPMVAQRMVLMQTGHVALDTLTGMMSNRIRFDKSRARAARKVLIKMTQEIPDAFHQHQMDPLSNARTALWINWTDFQTRAKTAQAAARGLNTRSQNGLRRTLPILVQACLSCHQAYRKTRKMVKTH